MRRKDFSASWEWGRRCGMIYMVSAPCRYPYKFLEYGSWSTVLGIPGAVFLSAWADSQYGPGRPIVIDTPLGPPGIVPAANPVPFLSAWADSQCVTNCAGRITVCRSVAAKLPCLPLWGRCPQNFHILWAERAVLPLLPSQSRLAACQLSQRESQGCGTINSNLSFKNLSKTVAPYPNMMYNYLAILRAKTRFMED